MTVRHFLRDDDLTAQEQHEVLDRALALKANPFSDQTFAGPQAVAIVFDKPSTRTRVSFATGVAHLGGYPLVIDSADSQLGRGEPVEDTARVLCRQTSAIVWRTFAQSGIETMARYSTVPVVNALTDEFHPCQVLADLLTLREHFGELGGRTLVYAGDGANNMSHSYLLGCSLAGMHVRIATPADHAPDDETVSAATRIAAEQGGSVTVSHDPEQAFADADVVVTDTWVSMGQEADKDARSGHGSPFAPFRVTEHAMEQAGPEAVFLHCLPAYRGKEVDAEVIDGPRSLVWDEAENRLHAQKALLSWLVEHSRPSTVSV